MPIPQRQRRPLTDHQIQEIATSVKDTDISIPDIAKTLERTRTSVPKINKKYNVRTVRIRTEIVGEPTLPSACYNIWGPDKLAAAHERIEALESELTFHQETIGRLLAGD